MIYGAIDIGTNAARMLIGEVCFSDNKFFMKKLSYTRLPLRLGEEVFDSGIISEKKEGDFIKTMQSFKLISEIFNVKELRAVSTSAMREATNRKSIIEKIYKKTDIELEIISGDEEAALILGAFDMLNLNKSDAYIVIDVGGGSTEISVFENGQRTNAKSFEIGTLRLLKNKVPKSSWQSMEKWIESNIDKKQKYTVFGTGGNINKVHKLIGNPFKEQLEISELKSFYDAIKGMDVETRIAEYKLKPDRADVIVPALKIYLQALKKMKAKNLFVPKIGLSDGVIYNFYKNQKNGK